MNRTTISRRNALKKAATALGGGTAALLAGSGVAAQASQIPCPRQVNTAGRTFRAFVRRGTGTSVEEVKLRPIQPREVLVRSQASGACYTIARSVLSTFNSPRASIPNHSGFVKLIEKGLFDVKSLVRTYPLERTRDAVQDVADRTVVAAVVVFA